MEIKIDVNDYWALKDQCWSNDSTFDRIEKYGLTEEFFDHIECLFSDGDIPSDTTVNDYIRFDFAESWIAEQLSLDYVDTIAELQEIADDLYMNSAEEVIDEAIDMNKGKKLWDYIHDQFNSSTSLQKVFEFIESDIDLESDLNEEEE